MLSSQEILAIVELAVYAPTLVLTIIIVFRHGFHRQLGWIFLSIFCTIRIAGSVFTILSINDPTNQTDLEWSGILRSVGLSPLILACFGLLKRVIDETSERLPSDPNGASRLLLNILSAKVGIVKRIAGKATATARRSRLIQVLQLVGTIALVLCVIGGIDEASSDPSDQQTGPGLIKAGIIMFVVLYAILLLLSLVSLGEIRKTPLEERRVLLAVLVSLPLLASRLLWSILSVFLTNSSVFNQEGGSLVAQILMATIEEFLIVVIFIILGFSVHRYSSTDARVGSPDSETHMQPMPAAFAGRHSDARHSSQRHGHYQKPSLSATEADRVAAYYGQR